MSLYLLSWILSCIRVNVYIYITLVLLFCANEQIDASLALFLQENDGHNARQNRTRRVSLYIPFLSNLTLYCIYNFIIPS